MKQDNPTKIIADNIRKYLKEFKMTQSELANKVGVKKSTMSDYLNYRAKPSHGVLQKIADTFGIRKSDLDTTFQITEDTVDHKRYDLYSIIGKNIETARKKCNISAEELADRIGVTKKTIRRYETAEIRVNMDRLESIANALDTSLDTLLLGGATFANEILNNNILSQLEPMKNTVQVPIIGNISCGNGVLAYEDIEGYEEIPADWVEEGDFFLRVVGDSMSGIRIMHDDLVLIRKQGDVNNGEVAAVCVEDEIVLKRVFKKNGMFILQSENPNYEPIVCTGYDNARIIGKLKKLIVNF
ncbi:XRE family transcriptional regulator [Bacillus albus]|uniref:XRE family transcriptional regulator n=1 Tax=Bacillus albus TaxID=2026189 RepID=UPI001F5D5FBF|nr:XRE family transcriptional regulator [Bacillus albus]